MSSAGLLAAHHVFDRRFRWSNASFVVGVATLALLWCGPMVPWSRVAFSGHMLLHLGVVVVAAPMLAAGVAAHLPPLAGFGEALSWSLLASLFEMVAVWGWHIPLLHDAASRDPRLFTLEQISFLLAGIAAWLIPFAAQRRETAAAGAIALFFTFTHMTMFGLILTLAPKLLYDPNFCRGSFGLDGLEDQHLGGALMAVGGGSAYLIGAMWTLGKAFRCPHQGRAR